MERASLCFLGCHNFTNFARVKDKNPVRRILDIGIRQEDSFMYLEVKAESFLWHQVRCMAEALLLVGTGETDETFITSLLAGEVKRAVKPAPAEGLILWETDCGIEWRPMAEAERSAAHIDHVERHHTLMAKVCQVFKKTGF
jgi:tRNA pseudouridine38-40 synthase